MNTDLEPLDPWPLNWPMGWPRHGSRRMSTFKFKGLTFGGARNALIVEVKRIGGTQLCLSSNLRVRPDGLPYADNRRIEDPGVAVYFQRGKRPVCMARDAYDTVAGNLRSLSLAIQYLRGLERHGGAIMVDRAFDGFTALPAPGTKTPWREVLRIEPESLEAMAPVLRYAHVRQAYLRRAQFVHPDMGGTNEQMAEVNAAWEEAQREVPAP